MASGRRRGRRKGVAILAPRPKPPKWKRCDITGKRGYGSKESAVRAMASFSRDERFKGQRVYRCPFCPCWHTTSQLK